MTGENMKGACEVITCRRGGYRWGTNRPGCRRPWSSLRVACPHGWVGDTGHRGRHPPLAVRASWVHRHGCPWQDIGWHCRRRGGDRRRGGQEAGRGWPYGVGHHGQAARGRGGRRGHLRARHEAQRSADGHVLRMEWLRGREP